MALIKDINMHENTINLTYSNALSLNNDNSRLNDKKRNFKKEKKNRVQYDAFTSNYNYYLRLILFRGHYTSSLFSVFIKVSWIRCVKVKY